MTRIILIGGPYDGMATHAPDPLPVYMHLAENSTVTPVVFPIPDMPMSSLQFVRSHIYRRELIVFPVASNTNFYVYSHTT